LRSCLGYTRRGSWFDAAGAGMAKRSQRPDSGAWEPAGVIGSRVAGGHHGVTRSALDAVRRRAESGAQGRRRMQRRGAGESRLLRGSDSHNAAPGSR
jgi:hypothetical protein